MASRPITHWCVWNRLMYWAGGAFSHNSFTCTVFLIRMFPGSKGRFGRADRRAYCSDVSAKNSATAKFSYDHEHHIWCFAPTFFLMDTFSLAARMLHVTLCSVAFTSSHLVLLLCLSGCSWTRILYCFNQEKWSPLKGQSPPQTGFWGGGHRGPL